MFNKYYKPEEVKNMPYMYGLTMKISTLIFSGKVFFTDREGIVDSAFGDADTSSEDSALAIVHLLDYLRDGMDEVVACWCARQSLLSMN